MVVLHTKDKIVDRHDIVRRSRKEMNVDEYQKEVEKIDWKELFESRNVDVINDIFVNKLSEVLDRFATIKICQKRKICRNWINEESRKESMYKIS